MITPRSPSSFGSLVLIDHAARRATLNVAIRLRLTTCWNVSSGIGPSLLIVRTDTPPPAVFTTASTPPSVLTASASASSVPSKSVTSHSTYDPPSVDGDLGARAPGPVEHGDLPTSGDDALGGGLRHPRRSTDRDQTQPLQFHARDPSVAAIVLACCLLRVDAQVRLGEAALGQPAERRRSPCSSPGCARRGRRDRSCWLTWHFSASILRSNVSVMSTTTSVPLAVARYDLADGPGLEALLEQLGVGERVARVGVDARPWSPRPRRGGRGGWRRRAGSCARATGRRRAAAAPGGSRG